MHPSDDGARRDHGSHSSLAELEAAQAQEQAQANILHATKLSEASPSDAGRQEALESLESQAAAILDSRFRSQGPAPSSALHAVPLALQEVHRLDPMAPLQPTPPARSQAGVVNQRLDLSPLDVRQPQFSEADLFRGPVWPAMPLVSRSTAHCTGGPSAMSILQQPPPPYRSGRVPERYSASAPATAPLAVGHMSSGHSARGRAVACRPILPRIGGSSNGVFFPSGSAHANTSALELPSATRVDPARADLGARHADLAQPAPTTPAQSALPSNAYQYARLQEDMNIDAAVDPAQGQQTQAPITQRGGSSSSSLHDLDPPVRREITRLRSSQVRVEMQLRELASTVRASTALLVESESGSLVAQGLAETMRFNLADCVMQMMESAGANFRQIIEEATPENSLQTVDWRSRPTA